MSAAVREDDVRNLYRLLLGRLPEPGWIATGWLLLDRQTIVANILSSREFVEGVALPLIETGQPGYRYHAAITRPFREWATEFFWDRPEIRVATENAFDWGDLVAAVLDDPGIIQPAGAGAEWDRKDLSIRFRQWAGRDTVLPDARVVELREPIYDEDVRFVQGLVDRASALVRPAWLRLFGITEHPSGYALVEAGKRQDFVGTPWFDRSWYRDQVGADANVNYYALLRHYVETGERSGLTPNPFFVADRYLAALPEARDAVRDGGAICALEDLAQFDGSWARPFPMTFDADFYREGPALAINGVDSMDFGVGPFAHYINVGWHEGRRPNRLFDASWFDSHSPQDDRLNRYPNAFSRFVNTGADGARYASPFFDPEVYLTANPDLRRLAFDDPGFDPLLHFLRHGHRDGRRCDEHDIMSRFGAYFARAIPDGTRDDNGMIARDVLLTLATDSPATDLVAEVVWRHGSPQCSILHGGKITAFDGQRFDAYLSGLASLPGAVLVDIAPWGQAPIVSRSLFTAPTVHGAISMSGLSGRTPTDGAYCARLTFDLDGWSCGRNVIALRFTFERDGLRRTVIGPSIDLLVSERPPVSDAAAEVQVLMASFNAPRDGFARQMDTILAQDLPGGTAISVVISDDASPREGRAIVVAASDDHRVAVSVSSQNLGFIHNFERAALMRSPHAQTFLMSDQDDAWSKDKVRTLATALATASCAYSDMRVVDRSGSVISPTFWDSRLPHHGDPITLATANAVTGAAAAFDSTVADLLVPFPRYSWIYHDQWLAVLSAAAGTIAYVDRQLYDYIQHEGNVLGFAGSRADFGAKWQAVYRILRHAARSGPGHRWTARELGALREADEAFPDLIQRFVMLTEALSRVRTWNDREAQHLAEGLCALVRGQGGDFVEMAMIWRRLRRQAGGNLALIGIDFRLCAAFLGQLCLRRTPSLLAQLARQDIAARDARNTVVGRYLDPASTEFSAKTEPVPIRIEEGKAGITTRVNIFMPELKAETFFGGYYSKIALADRLMESGMDVRLVLIDEAVVDYRDVFEIVQAFPELATTLLSAEIVAVGARKDPLVMSSRDRLIATTWWSAHIADDIRRVMGHAKFVYLIQEFEPFTFPMGTWYRGAEASYDLPHNGLYSTEILRSFFEARRIGQFAVTANGSRDWLMFENPITGLGRIERVPTSMRRKRLLFYARPQAHAARNMYQFGVEALRIAVKILGPDLDDWDLVGVGAQSQATVDLGSGRTLTLLSKLDADGYRRLLARSDIGLALMYTPHPSLVPIEMAKAGLVTITNCCETKTPDALRRISAHLISAAPDVDSIAAAIVAAVRGHSADVPDTVEWPTTARAAFPEEWMVRLKTLLDNATG